MRSLAPVFALLLSFVILCLGHGLQSVLLPARATLENYSTLEMGWLMSAYYVGFIAGTFLCPGLIARVGHINVFAAMAALACVIMLCYPLLPYSYAWIGLRCIYGLCLVHLYTVMESWLNSIGEPSTRGKILSVYMILNLLAMSGGQLLFLSTQTAGFEVFSLSAILLALALAPLLLSRINRPVHLPSSESFGVKKLYRVSPLGVTGAVIFGVANGAYWGLTAPYILDMGFSQNHIAWFMAATLGGGLVAQWPLGVLSDRVNRRLVILFCSVVVCLSAGILSYMAGVPDPLSTFGSPWLLIIGGLFGIGFHPLYSLCIAHTNDFVPAEHFVRASAGLQLVQSCGAVAGPLVAGALVQYAGYSMLYGSIALLFALFSPYILFRLIENRKPSQAQPFQLLTRTGIAAPLLDPRNDPDRA